LRALNETAQIIGERHALLEREQSALREADRAKDEFLAMLGHELRNPLSAITTATQVLNVAEPDGDMAGQSRRIIERQTRQIANAVLEVVDQGDGIAPDRLEHVFGLFVQESPGPDRARGSMGVGLALVKRLVEMHGGTVTAFSDGLGHGATFIVRLKAVPGERAAGGDDGPSMRMHIPRALRILVTEDNTDTREMMQMMLKLDGHEVRSAANGSETLSVLTEWRPDVVLLDIGLPDVEAYEVARQIRDSDARRRIKLIALTGFGQVEDERRAYDAGFDLHLIKPVAPDALRDVLAAITRENG
jgi:CheY-like chemotaxis protein